MSQRTSQDADVGLVGEEAVDARTQKGDLLVEGLAIAGRIGAHASSAGRNWFSARNVYGWTVSPARCASVTREEGVPSVPSGRRGITWFLSGPIPSTTSLSSPARLV